MSKQTTSEKPEIIIEEGENGLVISVPSDVHVEIKQEEKAPERNPTKLDNMLTLGLVGVLALAVIIAMIRRATKKDPVIEMPAEPVPVVEVEAPTAPGSAGKLKLYGTDPKTAAMVMAIVADKLQKPINELRFISIKEVEK